MALKLTIRHKGADHSTETLTDFGHGVSRALAFQHYGADWGATLWEDTDKMAAGLSPVKFKTGVALYYTTWDAKHGAQGVDCRTMFIRMRERLMAKLEIISKQRHISDPTYPGMASSSTPTHEATLALEVMEELKGYIG